MRDRKENGTSSPSRRLFITRPTGRISCNRNVLDRIFFRSVGAMHHLCFEPSPYCWGQAPSQTAEPVPPGLRAMFSRRGSAISQRTIMTSAG